MRTIVVCGAGGFIGGHLVASLRRDGNCRIRAIDRKPFSKWYQVFDDVDNRQLDLQLRENCAEAVLDADEVYNLAADMGGMGFIENNKSLCTLSVLINAHLLNAARHHGVERFFFSSSACVYNQDKQMNPDVTALREEDAYPALPEPGYGWEKLYSEHMCQTFAEDFDMAIRVARYHNVYGPHGTWDGGREKAPAAICRKVAHAQITGGDSIEIWGDGTQTRSFTFIDDTVRATRELMASDVTEPLNIGSSELVTINQLVDIAEDIAGVKLERNHLLDAPKGVNGRNSDNTKFRNAFGWEPSISLREGLEKTYRWIHDQMTGEPTSVGKVTALPAVGGRRPSKTAAREDIKKIALLGVGGFIGSHLVEHLTARGTFDLIGVDVEDEKLQDLDRSRLTFHEADLRSDRALMEDIIQSSDLVVDLVAHANPSLYVEEPAEVFELNFMLNLEVAKLCMRHRKRLIQYSSAEVYGKVQEGGRLYEDESDFLIGPVTKQRWIYSAGKALLERVLHAYGLLDELEYTIIRPFNFIGSRIDYLVPAGSTGGPRVFPHFMSALLTGGPMYLVDGGDTRRAFLHIDDASRGFMTLLDNYDRSRNEIYNIGNPENDITIRGLAILMQELYEELTGEKASCELVEITGDEFYGPGYEDADRLPPDTGKLMSLGWKPQHGLRETFRAAMIEYLEHPVPVADSSSAAVLS